MFLILIVQIHSTLTMKNKNNMVSKIKLYILVILTIAMVSCGNKTENPIEKSYNNPDFKMDIVTESEEYFKFKGGKYYVYKNLEKSTGNMSSTISNEITKINRIDSTDLPDIEAGEYRNIGIEFIDDNHVNLKLSSFRVERDPDYNVKENWITKCEIVEGSKSIFYNNGNITLKCLNCDESDLSNSVLSKGILSKMVNSDPEKSTSIFKTSNYQIVCNKKEIFWKANYNYKGEFTLDPELKELYKAQ